MSLSGIAPASRSVFSAGSNAIRIVEYTDTHPFRGIDSITRQDLEYHPALHQIVSLDTKRYIAEYGGMPGIVKGVSTGFGMLVFSENMKLYTQVCSSRVAGNKIKFGYGSEQVIYDRNECWEFCVKRERIQVVTEIQKQKGIDYPLVITRSNTTTCPICLDDLSGNVVCCVNKHQICLQCYGLLPETGGYKIKQCPFRCEYSMEEVEKVDKMNGVEESKSPYLYFTTYARYKMDRFYYNEALFLYMMKYAIQCNYLDVFRSMLLSSLYNYYVLHPDSFSTFNFSFTKYKDNDNRSYSPAEDELPEVVQRYLDDIENPEIIKDIKHTRFYMTSYHDIDFYRELTELDGNLNRLADYPENKVILQREVYWRYKIKHNTKSNLGLFIKDTFNRIITVSSRYGCMFERINQEVEL